MASIVQSGSEEVQLLSAWPSPFVWRVKAALALKQVSYTEVPQALAADQKSDLLLKSNPVHKKVPVLIHAGRPVCESIIIIEYIDEAFSTGAAILPKDAFHRATARFWADYCDKKVFPALFKILKSNGPEERQAAVGEAREILAVLDQAFSKSPGPFFGMAGGDGVRVGLVDVVILPLAAWLPAAEAALGIPKCRIRWLMTWREEKVKLEREKFKKEVRLNLGKKDDSCLKGMCSIQSLSMVEAYRWWSYCCCVLCCSRSCFFDGLSLLANTFLVFLVFNVILFFLRFHLHHGCTHKIVYHHYMSSSVFGYFPTKVMGPRHSPAVVTMDWTP